jgi:hypothetical protein
MAATRPPPITAACCCICRCCCSAMDFGPAEGTRARGQGWQRRGVWDPVASCSGPCQALWTRCHEAPWRFSLGGPCGEVVLGGCIRGPRTKTSYATVLDNLFPMRKKNFLSTGPETTRKRSVCSRASKCTIERVPY